MRKRPRPDGIIAWLPDRLARNMRDAGEIIELLDAGPLADLKFPMYAFHNDSSGKEHLAMEFARAKAYSDHLQDNVLRGLIEQELKGRGTRPLPPAYTVIEDEDSDDYLKIIPSDLHGHWRDAYRWKIDLNLTNEAIATRLVENGYVHRYRYKKRWQKAVVDKDYVGRHLKNPLHCGWLVTGEDSKEPRRADLNDLFPKEFGEEFPVVVTLEDFKKVNPQLFSDTAGGARKPQRRSFYPLAGKVFCKCLHESGQLATMTGNTPKGGSGILSPRFTCQRCTPQHSANMEEVYKAVGEKLKGVKLTERDHKKLVVTEWVRFERERDEAETNRRQLNVMKGENKRDLEEAEGILNKMKYGTPRASQGEVAAQERTLKRLREEQKNLVKREEKLNEEGTARYDDLDAFLELSRNGSAWWEKASPEKKRGLAEILVSNGGKVASVTLNPQFEEWSKREKTDDGRDDRTRTCDLMHPMHAL